MNTEKAANTDQYIAGFPLPVRERLELIRSIIQHAAPDASEKISYGMPAFFLHGNLVYFAGYQRHIGFYPGAAIIDLFQDRLQGYKTAKGSIQIQHDQEIPLDLIVDIVHYRIKQNTEKASFKNAKTKP